LLSDVEAKKINLVITKDYSRLGRNARETEYLREDFFPRKGCRYVAMNDNIDTAYDDDFAPFKAIFNEHYSRDISKKVHSSYKNQTEKGVYTGTVAPFGYLKDPDKPGHLIIDPETVDAVKQIFTWAAEGHGVAYIKRRLESGKIA
jgi:site-specific DNA recombinase